LLKVFCLTFIFVHHSFLGWAFSLVIKKGVEKGKEFLRLIFFSVLGFAIIFNYFREGWRSG